MYSIQNTTLNPYNHDTHDACNLSIDFIIKLENYFEVALYPSDSTMNVAVLIILQSSLNDTLLNLCTEHIATTEEAFCCSALFRFTYVGVYHLLHECKEHNFTIPSLVYPKGLIKHTNVASFFVIWVPVQYTSALTATPYSVHIQTVINVYF